MGRRKIENKNIRKLGTSGQKSITVTLPIEIVRGLKWRKGQKVVVKKQGGRVVIEDWKK